jgi:hypothetical protein
MVRASGFRAWLRTQETHETSIGDLARDMKADGCLGDREGLREIREHFRAHRAQDVAIEALDDAPNEVSPA